MIQNIALFQNLEATSLLIFLLYPYFIFGIIIKKISTNVL